MPLCSAVARATRHGLASIRSYSRIGEHEFARGCGHMHASSGRHASRLDRTRAARARGTSHGCAYGWGQR
jgi:hypothetical protein